MYKDYDPEKVLQTNSRVEGCRALANAHNAFINLRTQNNIHNPSMKYIIVIVVRVFEKNCIDLRGIEHTLQSHFGITARLYSLPQLAKCAHLNETFDFVMFEFFNFIVESIYIMMMMMVMMMMMMMMIFYYLFVIKKHLIYIFSSPLLLLSSSSRYTSCTSSCTSSSSSL
jgi:hypothetical protein